MLGVARRVGGAQWRSSRKLLPYLLHYEVYSISFKELGVSFDDCSIPCCLVRWYCTGRELRANGPAMRSLTMVVGARAHLRRLSFRSLPLVSRRCLSCALSLVACPPLPHCSGCVSERGRLRRLGGCLCLPASAPLSPSSLAPSAASHLQPPMRGLSTCLCLALVALAAHSKATAARTQHSTDQTSGVCLHACPPAQSLRVLAFALDCAVFVC